MKDSTAIRRFTILEAITAQGNLTFSEIRQLFQDPVSDPTLRNDIKELSILPEIVKDSRGGLRIRPRSVFDKQYFGVNLQVNSEAKDLIARCLVFGEPPFKDFPLIDLTNDAVVAGPGTSVLAVLRLLAGFPSVEILTTNVGVFEIPKLMQCRSLHLSGGRVLPSVASFVGSAAERNINAFPANTAIVGVSGIFWNDKNKLDIWLCCHQEDQLPVKKALVHGRKKVIVVTCNEKLNRSDVHRFCSITEILSEADFYIFTDKIDQVVHEKLSDRFKALEKLVKNNHVAKIIEVVKE